MSDREPVMQCAVELISSIGLPSAEPCLDRLQLSLRLRPAPAPCGSRFGGLPDLPPGLEWPVGLAFLAQLNLAELPPHELLPPSGWLWFFYDAEGQPSGFSPSDRSGFRVLYSERRGPRPVEKPAALADYMVFTASRAVEGAWEATLPDEAPFDVAWNDPVAETYRDLLQQLAAPEPVHRLLGHPQPIQSDMTVCCQLASNGVNVGGPEVYRDPSLAVLREGARDWSLLLQLDSDDDLFWCWGKYGRIYFWIRRQDLAVCAFDRVWVVQQCS